jgi:hypothetical protein
MILSRSVKQDILEAKCSERSMCGKNGSGCGRGDMYIGLTGCNRKRREMAKRVDLAEQDWAGSMPSIASMEVCNQTGLD